MRHSIYESESTPRGIAQISSKRLLSNLDVILDQVPGLWVIPMIKADAYGHGADWAARTLAQVKGVRALGVATFEEAKAIRRALGPRGKNTAIVVFSGATPWREDYGALCENSNFVPVITSEDDWHRFLKGGWVKKISYELKFNTGMNRLGINPAFASKIIKSLAGHSALSHPGGILTHLALAEDPSHRLSQLQLERYTALRADLANAFPRAQFHFANSSAIWNSKYWRVPDLSDGVRPGLALYGVPPFPGAPARGLLPVMTARAQVVTIHSLKPGEYVGYGATYRVPTQGSQVGPKRVGIFCAGYADGIPVALSGRGQVALGDSSAKILGRVSMDMTAIECGAKTRVGDFVEWTGDRIDPWKFASEAGSHPYEVLTSIGSRVQRKYV